MGGGGNDSHKVGLSLPPLHATGNGMGGGGGCGTAPGPDPGVQISGVIFCFQTSWGAHWRKTWGDTGEVSRASGLTLCSVPGADTQIQHPDLGLSCKIWSQCSGAIPGTDAWVQYLKLMLWGSTQGGCSSAIFGAEAPVQCPGLTLRYSI